MYTEKLTKDLILFNKAILSNQLAKFLPGLYVRLTHQTGRGGGQEDEPKKIADYFNGCFNDYRSFLKLRGGEFTSFLNKKRVLEYGPGDILGVAVLLFANGAEKVHCVDRFPLSNLSRKNIETYSCLLKMLDKSKRERAQNAFKENGKPESGFDETKIYYNVTKDGLADEQHQYDLIISRAVLEHVNDLKKTFRNIKHSLRNGGASLHKVDLKSHGLDRYTDFDFLTWPNFVYNLMYSHKGFPNRHRVDTYKKFAQQAGLKIKQLVPTGHIDIEKLTRIYPYLPNEFKKSSLDDLSWKGFWIHLEHA